MVTTQSSELFNFHETLTQTEDRLAREVLERITARWSLSVMRVLADANGPLRFSRVLERVEGISQKALTQTLRTLERDGLITRTLYPQVPPRVEYALTAKGRALVPLIEDMRVYGREWLACVEDEASVANFSHAIDYLLKHGSIV